MRALALLALTISMASYAQPQMPSDSDLRTSYCIPVLQAAITEYQGLAQTAGPGLFGDGFAQSAKGWADDLKRLQGYLIPKVPSLNTTALEVAYQRGQQDVVSTVQAELSCFTQCEGSKPAKGFDDRYGQCLQSCHAASPVIGRTRACRQVNWLPF